MSHPPIRPCDPSVWSGIGFDLTVDVKHGARRLLRWETDNRIGVAQHVEKGRIASEVGKRGRRHRDICASWRTLTRRLIGVYFVLKKTVLVDRLRSYRQILQSLT